MDPNVLSLEIRNHLYHSKACANVFEGSKCTISGMFENLSWCLFYNCEIPFSENVGPIMMKFEWFIVDPEVQGLNWRHVIFSTSASDLNRK